MARALRAQGWGCDTSPNSASMELSYSSGSSISSENYSSGYSDQCVSPGLMISPVYQDYQFAAPSGSYVNPNEVMFSPVDYHSCQPAATSYHQEYSPISSNKSAGRQFLGYTEPCVNSTEVGTSHQSQVRQSSGKSPRRGSSKTTISSGSEGSEGPSTRYVCMHPGCAGNFSRLTDLKRHVKCVHDADNNRYDCPHKWCGRTGNHGFTRKDHMNEHIREVHKQNIPKGHRRSPKA